MAYNETPTDWIVMNSVKQKLVSAKNKVVDNRAKILGTVAVVATTVAVLQHQGIKSMCKFLDEKGLTEEYFTPDAD